MRVADNIRPVMEAQMRIFRHTLTDELLEVFERLEAHQLILESFPDEGIALTDEQLEGIAGGVLSAEDIAYCQQAVEYYHGRGYTLADMKKEMLDYQSSLRTQGDAALADRSAEYLEYMVSIW